MRSSSEFRSPPKSSIPPCISVTNLLITSRHARSTSPRALSDVCPFGPDPRGGMYAALSPGGLLYCCTAAVLLYCCTVLYCCTAVHRSLTYACPAVLAVLLY